MHLGAERKLSAGALRAVPLHHGADRRGSQAEAVARLERGDIGEQPYDERAAGQKSTVA